VAQEQFLALRRYSLQPALVTAPAVQQHSPLPVVELLDCAPRADRTPSSHGQRQPRTLACKRQIFG